MENNNKLQFTWTITNFSNLKNSKKLYSDNFVLHHHTWRVLILPKGKILSLNYLSIYLDAGGDCSNLPHGWEKFAYFFIALKNQVNDKMTIRKGTQYRFSAKEIDWGFTEFIPLDEFYDSGGGFIVNDICIVEVEFFLSESAYKNQLMKLKYNIDKSFGELVEFRGLGKLEKVFVPLLEEVCSKYPSLIDIQHKRSRRFTEWAFTALGRVLHFLKTKKVKDMDNEACCHLQLLWEELKICGFDLTWLEFHVQSALAVKIYMEKDAQVKKIEHYVAALEIESKILVAKMIETNSELETARRDLVNAKEDLDNADDYLMDFEVRSLDEELGYGII